VQIEENVRAYAAAFAAAHRDRKLNTGFLPSIRNIVGALPRQRQMLVLQLRSPKRSSCWPISSGARPRSCKLAVGQIQRRLSRSWSMDFNNGV